MNQPVLPPHLQNRQSRHLAETAAQGLGGSLPPHISIQGNAFCLIDATGAEQPVVFVNPADGRQYNQPYLDTCVVDISDVLCKRYYGGKAWTPDSKDPPVCWSANGVGPSREAPQPQCRTCAECPNNVRGSDVSKISGAAIKACRDEKWIAVLLPGFGKDMLFQLVLTPGSFQNWKAYIEKFKGQAVDLSDVVTRMEFEQGKNGVLKFDVSPAGYIDPPTADLRERVLLDKLTDIFVGRTDQPITMLAPPTGGQAPLAPAATAVYQPTPAPAALLPAASAAPPASFPPQGQAGPVYADPTQPTRRRRRTAAQIEADNAAAAGQQTLIPPQGGQVPPGQPAQAPFRPAPPPARQEAGQAPAAPLPPNQAQFGIGQGAPPNPELAAMLNQHFGPAGGGTAGGGR